MADASNTTNPHGIATGDNYTPSLILEKLPETMKVASDETEAGYVIINVADFDPKQHKKYVEKKAAPPAAS